MANNAFYTKDLQIGLSSNKSMRDIKSILLFKQALNNLVFS